MARRPNILFVLSDQQRFDTVNCYASDAYPSLHPNLTPHLDRMAAEGVRFNHAFTMQPVCGPARSCLQSGQYATQTGCVTNAVPLPQDVPTIAKSLDAAGYETAYVGKWHLASEGWDNRIINRPVPVEKRGGYRTHWMASDVLEFTSHGYEGYMFDTQGNRVDFEGYRVDATANFVIDYLRDRASRKSESPFFMFASFIEPHHQNDLDRYIGPMGSKQRFAKYHTPGDLVGTKPEPGRRADWPQHMPDYLGCCWSLDQNMGRIRAELEALGEWDNTIVIYTADHGCHFCTRNSEYKRSCHEASIHIPMIACGPGFSGGKVIDDIVSLIDLPPTVLTAAGAEVPDTFAGRPVQGVVDGTATDWPEEAFTQISESQWGRSIRTKRWKYCVNAEGYKHERGKFATQYVEQYLYDLDVDPYERNNLVSDAAHKQTRAELAERLKRRMTEAGEPVPTITPAA